MMIGNEGALAPENKVAVVDAMAQFDDLLAAIDGLDLFSLPTQVIAVTIFVLMCSEEEEIVCY